MTDSSYTSSFDAETREAFAVYLRDNPNIRRVTPADWSNIMDWLTNPLRRPTCQAEHSRRNYVRRTFYWDESTQTLMSMGPTDSDKRRIVVTDDRIVEFVEYMHHNINHGGWDATWKAVSSNYYGILRADVIFLLKRCSACAFIPSKQPKGITYLYARAGPST
ncbi:hypothetical protein NA57DRAFT_78933 [Rhizodiscina lignyota]|uniref:Integrase zinc-binding domain-containing protein n=1 Tax=Rhizodiscina lignyota TaxID=1504668 RepID=A0A9P4M3W6_9PEZI|nr:hypothetical protein NA57DRAFT_78933 [Rhizodiscina lignyota]